MSDSFFNKSDLKESAFLRHLSDMSLAGHCSKYICESRVSYKRYQIQRFLAL